MSQRRPGSPVRSPRISSPAKDTRSTGSPDTLHRPRIKSPSTHCCSLFFLKWVPTPYSSLLVLQVLAWLGTSLLVARLAHRFLGAPEAATALAVALWPPILVYVLSYHPLWLRATALVFTIAAASRYRDTPSHRRAAELGLVLGIAALARTTFLALPIAILPWALERERSPRVAHASLALAVAAVVISPWIIRNRIVLDAWIPGTTSSGYALLVGNHPGANGTMDFQAQSRIVGELPQGFSRCRNRPATVSSGTVPSPFWRRTREPACVSTFRDSSISGRGNLEWGASTPRFTDGLISYFGFSRCP